MKLLWLNHDTDSRYKHDCISIRKFKYKDIDSALYDLSYNYGRWNCIYLILDDII